MLKNKLKINDENTEFLLITRPLSQSKIKADHRLQIGNASISTPPSARNVGVTYDSQMAIEKYVTNV